MLHAIELGSPHPRRAEAASEINALKAHALKGSRKLEGQSRKRPHLSSGIDPGPSGFDWEEL